MEHLPRCHRRLFSPRPSRGKEDHDPHDRPPQDRLPAGLDELRSLGQTLHRRRDDISPHSTTPAHQTATSNPSTACWNTSAGPPEGSETSHAACSTPACRRRSKIDPPRRYRPTFKRRRDGGFQPRIHRLLRRAGLSWPRQVRTCRSVLRRYSWLLGEAVGIGRTGEPDEGRHETHSRPTWLPA